MSIASEITRLQGVKADILSAIAYKGVTVPSGSALADCPNLIESIETGGGETSGVKFVQIVPNTRFLVVDSNGYIGEDVTQYVKFSSSSFLYSFAIQDTLSDFSALGLGQVSIVTPSPNTIGGKTYKTCVVSGRRWLAENLDYLFNGIAYNERFYSSSYMQAWHVNLDEETYGWNGRKYGLLYNGPAVDYMVEHASELFPGWHVPTFTEWQNMWQNVGSSDSARSENVRSVQYWSGNGNTELGIVPAGYFNDSFNNVGNKAFFYVPPSNQSYNMIGIGTNYFEHDAYNNACGFSVRLISDDT